MPYSSISELPDTVKSRYSERCQEVFRKAFNSAMSSTTGGGAATEEGAFKVAHTAAGMCRDAGKAQPLKATILDDDKFRLLAIPFGGPIPSPVSAKGVDLDGEWFSERTDIKPDWLPFREVDWHHGNDDTFRRTVIAKADNLVMEEDGWWVDVWLKHGEKRLELIRKLAERGAQIFGSSESVAGMVKKADTGEILVWPYWRQTLSTSPQNTHSVLRPLKAALEDAVNEYTPSPSFWADIEASMRDLGADLRLTSLVGDVAAKSGRVHSAADIEALNKALEAFDVAYSHVRKVLDRQPDYSSGRAAE